MVTMAALVKTKAAPGLELCQVPFPEYGPDEVLIKIKKTAICGTDVHIYNWDRWSQEHIKVPMAIGHEYSGDIVAMGDMVRGLKIGQRVTGEGHITCGFCRNCRAGLRHFCRNTLGVGVDRAGAFAEYLALPAFNVIPLPDNISDEIASIFDPLGNAIHTALAYDLVGEDVLITGAGPIGIMAACVALFCGARYVVLTDINQTRLELARKIVPEVDLLNTRETHPRDIMKQLGMTEGFDVGLEMSGSPQALDQMLSVMKTGAKIALLGTQAQPTTVDWNRVIFNGLTIRGIYGREMFETWYKMIAMIQSGLDLTSIITHRFNYRDYEAGFAAMISGQAGKVILDWTGEEK